MGTITKADPISKDVKVKVLDDKADGERTLSFVVTTNLLDRDHERVDVKSLRLPLKGGGYVRASDLTGNEPLDIPLLLNHSFDVQDVIGSLRKAYLNESDELVADFGISKRAKAQDMLMLFDEGHLDNAVSITMNDYDYQDSTIYDAEIVEISLVFRGSNKEARLLAVKSLIKGENMAEAKTREEKEAEIARLQAELANEPVKTDEEAEPIVTQPKDEAETPVQADGPVVTPKAEKPDKSVKKEKNMTNTIATKQVQDPVKEQVIEKKPTLTKDQQRELFVKQMIAFKSKDYGTLAQLNEKAYEADTDENKDLKKKVISFADGTSVFQTEVVSSDILLQYTNIGRVGSLVTRIDITGAETWKQIVQTRGTGFQPVGAEEVKPEDKPVWTSLSIEPKEHAMIVAWYDGMAKRTPLAVYQTIINYIADEYARLEDKIILSFNGVTTGGGDVFARTGLVPTIEAAGRIVNIATFTAADTQSGLGRAYGLIESDKQLSIVASRKTWGMMATTVDTLGRNVFTTVGQQVVAGALGSFNVVVSQEVTDGKAVMGAFADYELVTNGGLETLFSREATVGSLNLFTSDASALRANADVAGKPIRNNSFVVIDYVPQVS